MEKTETHIYTVSELTRDIRFLLEDAFPEIWVEGEISNFKVYTSGHAYFSLKDENSLINCVMFKNSSSRLAFDVEDGLHVLCYGRISVYDKRGQYQFYVSKMEPKGKGALQLAFEQLKEKLRKEGLFAPEHKKPLPYLPVHIGVVTSPTGAAIRDILKVAKRRFTNVEITICPVKVQGEEAKHEIAKAIEEFNEYNSYLAETGSEEHPIDVLIVGRGGGSLEDLWPFNEEKVTRAIFASEIPVISAVGHEVDYTISDFTADFRAPTPSAAAELVIPVKEELAGRIMDYALRMKTAVRSRIDILEKDLKRLKESYVLRAPMNVFLQLQQQLDDLAKSVQANIAHCVEIKSKEFAGTAGKLEMLSPLAVLERGYSITFKGEKTVKTAAGLKAGDALRTRLARGEVFSTVKRIEKERAGGKG
ncbi:MAG: exodeoxyribonuclease VII large subunit [Candidatus Omnitrophota bacterium]